MKLEQAVVVLVFCSCLVGVYIGGHGEIQGMSPSKIILFCLIYSHGMQHAYIISAMSTVKLTSSIDKSGRLAVCHNETIVYTCRTWDVLTWNIYIKPLPINELFFANDSDCQRFVADNVLGRYFMYMYLQNNGATDNYLLSDLVIPYNPEWNGTQVQCMSGLVSKNITYVVTGK